MAEYIKRYDAMKICRGYSQHCFETNDSNGQDIADRIEDDIVEIPTADVAEVVRCRECKYFKTFKGLGSWCHRRIRSDIEYKTKPYDFCSYGERKRKP